MERTIFSRLDARDRALFARWSALPQASPAARAFWATLTHLGGARVTILAAIAPLAIRGAAHAPMHGAAVGAAREALVVLALSHVLVQLVKRTVGRPRPSRSLGCATLVHEPDQFSFPSGHSAAAMSIAIAYAHAFPGLAPVLIVLAVLVGMSRVILGVHYPGDVLMGQLLAALTAVGVMIL